MATINATTGENRTGQLDVQIAINSASPGDTVVIPSGTYVWDTPITIARGGNLKLIGGNSTLGGRPVINAAGGLARFILWTVYDTGSPKHTAEVGYIEFGGAVTNEYFTISGRTTITQVGNVYTGGIRIHHCRFAYQWYVGNGTTKTCSFQSGLATLTPTGVNTFSQSDVGRVVYGSASIPLHAQIITVPNPTTATISRAPTAQGVNVALSFTGITPAVGWELYHIDGWIMGVMDHCDLDTNLLRYTAKQGTVNHFTDPSGNGFAGDYSYGPDVLGGKQELGGTLTCFCLEDNILRHGAKAVTDTGGTTVDGGGGILLSRHNTRWCSIAVHGTRESGNRQHGGRLMESYNDHYLRHINGLEPTNDTDPHESRDGEQIYYNNFITVQTGGDFNANSVQGWGGEAATYAVSYNPNAQSNWYWGGADGLNPWDQNAKGIFTDSRTGFTHEPYFGYTFVTSGSTYVTGFDNVTHGVDLVSAGVPEPRHSDVYGIVTGGGLSSSIGTYGAKDVIGATISGTNMPNPIPKNYFRGFVIRNPGVPRIGSPNLNAYTYICASSASASGSTVINLELRQLNLPSGSHPDLAYNPAGMELRMVLTYQFCPGGGSLPVAFVSSSIPAALVPGSGLAQRWLEPLSNGIWRWGNMRRLATAAAGASTPFVAENRNGRMEAPSATNAIPTAGMYELTCQKYHHYNGGRATNIVPGQPSAGVFQELFNRGYTWNPAIVAGSVSATKVGADWSKDFTDPVTGQLVASTIPGNTISPEFASFDATGVGGLIYPHPLALAPTAQPPSISSTNNTKFTVGVAGSFTVKASGDPTISFSIPATGVGGVPSGGWLAIDSSTGELSGTPPNATGQPFTFIITATNSAGSGTQSFTLNIATSLSITLDTPLNGQRFDAPAIISLTATLTGGAGTPQVDFYNGATIINSTIIVPYSFTWSNIAAGSYDLKVASGAAVSDVATIIVEDAPLDAPAAINVTG